MKTLRSIITTVLVVLAFALPGNHFNAFAQEGKTGWAPTSNDARAEASHPDEVPVAAEDIDSLIDNLSGGVDKVFRVRVLSAGQVVEYPESMIAVQRDAGVFNSQTRSLVTTGTMNGIAMIEDFRFLHYDGKFYVLRDIHLNGTATDVANGRSTPTILETTSPSIAGEDVLKGVLRENAMSLKAAPPTITAIHGYTDVPVTGIYDGLADMSCGRTYNNYRVIDNVQPSVFDWDIIGSNFGTTKGTIQVAGITVPASQVSWGPTEIKFYPAVPYYFVAGPTVLSISTSNDTVTSALNFAPAISGRIFGQCTWLVALMRMNAGKPVPSSSFGPGGGWNTLAAGYAPQLWDALTYRWTDSQGAHTHTAVIVGVSAPVKSGNTTTWTVTIEEANAACSNRITTKQSSFQVQNGQITKPIQSDAKSGLAPGWYYR
jgi:hypothetical protein